MTTHRTPEEIELAAAGEGERDPHFGECASCTAALLETLRMKRAVREAMPRFAPPDALRERIAALGASETENTPPVIPTEREGPGGPGGATKELHGPALPPRSLATLGMTAGAAPPPRASRSTPALPLPRASRSAAPWWLATAAAILLVVIGGTAFFRARGAAARELVDLHSTIVASANPIDVVSTDRHTVKPWFEGRVPFAVDVPELRGTAFRLVGGRVVFWRGRIGAYLLVAKGAHRISLFAFDEDDVPPLGGTPRESIESWSRGGVRWIAVADLPQNDLAALRAFWTR